MNSEDSAGGSPKLASIWSLMEAADERVLAHEDKLRDSGQEQRTAMKDENNTKEQLCDCRNGSCTASALTMPDEVSSLKSTVRTLHAAIRDAAIDSVDVGEWCCMRCGTVWYEQEHRTVKEHHVPGCLATPMDVTK